MPAFQLVQAPENGASESALREYYGAILGSAYVRYLGVLADGNVDGNTRIGRVPTLAEWRGHVQWPTGVGHAERVVWEVCDSSVGAARVSGERVGAGRDSGRAAGVETVAEDSGKDDGGASARDSGVHDAGGASVGEQADVVSERGPNYERNRANREKKKNQQRRWREKSGAQDEKSSCEGCASASGSAQTVDTRTGVEIEAAQTLAARRVAENKLKILEAKAAAKLVEHRLRALNDKERTLVIDRLAAARLEEKINTSKKRSQDSFKGCDSPIESVGSALSAHEFAFKQQVRKIEAQKVENKYKDEQLKKFYQYASPDVRQMVAEIPEPYIPTDEEMEAEDLDQSPEPTDEEMEAEAARYFS